MVMEGYSLSQHAFGERRGTMLARSPVYPKGQCIQTDKPIHTRIHTHWQFRVSFTWPACVWTVAGKPSSRRTHDQACWEHTNTNEAHTQRDETKQTLLLWNLTFVPVSIKKKSQKLKVFFLLWFHISIIRFLTCVLKEPFSFHKTWRDGISVALY